MLIEFTAQKREMQGTGASRRLRRTGRIPGIVYGGDQPPEAIDVDHNDILHKLSQESFHASVLTMLIDGAKQNVLLRDVQMHAFRRQVMHLDFQRVDASQKIHTKVPLHFINAEIAPGVKLQGGIVSHALTDLDVQCLPADLPEFIEVDLKDLTHGHPLHVSEVPMPKGVEAVVHRGEDPVVASITMSRGAAADAAAEAEAEVAEEQQPVAAPPAEKK